MEREMEDSMWIDAGYDGDNRSDNLSSHGALFALIRNWEIKIRWSFRLVVAWDPINCTIKIKMYVNSKAKIVINSNLLEYRMNRTCRKHNILIPNDFYQLVCKYFIIAMNWCLWMMKHWFYRQIWRQKFADLYFDLIFFPFTGDVSGKTSFNFTFSSPYTFSFDYSNEASFSLFEA